MKGMYLLTQSKNWVSALELMRQLGISYSAAWRMMHKLMQVMKERDDQQPLVGIIQLVQTVRHPGLSHVYAEFLTDRGVELNPGRAQRLELNENDELIVLTT